MYQCASEAEYDVLHKTWQQLVECQKAAMALSTALNATDAYSGYSMDNLLCELDNEIREHAETMADWENPRPRGAEEWKMYYAGAW